MNSETSLKSFEHILRNFDEVLQTKSNKVTVDQQINAMTKDYISEAQLRSFTKEHSQNRLEQAELLKL